MKKIEDMTDAEKAIYKVSELNKLVSQLNKFGRDAGLHNKGLGYRPDLKPPE